jgi:hypothetical protein
MTVFVLIIIVCFLVYKIRQRVINEADELDNLE